MAKTVTKTKAKPRKPLVKPKKEAVLLGFDLFGEPFFAGQAGRPNLVISDDLRRKVSILRATGMTIADIALSIGVSERSLRNHFRDDYTRGAAEKKAEIRLKLYEKGVDDGNVAALAKLLGLDERADALPPVPKEKPARVEPLGKKEQAIRDASDSLAGSDWGDLLEEGTPRH